MKYLVIIKGLVFLLLVKVVKCGYDDFLSRNDTESLQLVHIIFRHGNRTTIQESIYPLDPHINETYYPFGHGELTQIGKINAYNLGLDIRERYQYFLNETYFPPEIKAFTSNVSRTKMTLQSVLTAMYPPVWPNLVLPYLMWQPISYETIPTKDDNLINIKCHTNLTTKTDEALEDLYQYVSEHTGKQIEHSYDILNVYDTILVEKQNGFDVPDWAEDIFTNGKLQDAALTYWTDIIEQQLPIHSGFLIKKITEDSIRNSQNDTETKLYLYSGHDNTISAILGVFDAYGPDNKYQIEYLSQIYLELHKINNKYGFKVYSKNGPGYPLIQLKFKKCKEDFCLVEDFIESTKHVYEPLPKCE